MKLRINASDIFRGLKGIGRESRKDMTTRWQELTQILLGDPDRFAGEGSPSQAETLQSLRFRAPLRSGEGQGNSQVRGESRKGVSVSRESCSEHIRRLGVGGLQRTAAA